MERKFKVGDKVACIAGYYKHATGVILKTGNGHQPFYFIEWETRNNCGYVYATSWGHENHLIPFGKTKEKEIEMNDLKKMEVGKLYKARGSRNIIKVISQAVNGHVFAEYVETNSRCDTTTKVGDGTCIHPSFFDIWVEYTEPRKIYINVFKYGKQEYANCYNTIEDADKAKDQYSTYRYEFIKRIETEI